MIQTATLLFNNNIIVIFSLACLLSLLSGSSVHNQVQVIYELFPV